MRFPRRAATLLIGCAAWVSAVLGNPQTAPSAGLPQITVQGEALRLELEMYVSKLTRASLWSDDHPLKVWRRPICPLVAGLPRQAGQFVFDRLTEDLTAVGVSMGAVGCKPNFIIAATPRPDVDLQEWRKRFWLIFGQAGFDGKGEPPQKFIAEARPVRIWYDASLVDEAGNGSSAGAAAIIDSGMPNGSGFGGLQTFQTTTSPRAEFIAVPALSSVIAVIDMTQVAGMDWRQVTDYIAFAGLTSIDLDADLRDAPSIMRLFSATASAKPNSLSAWDRAFLSELYHTSQMARHQRVEIARRMLQDVAAHCPADDAQTGAAIACAPGATPAPRQAGSTTTAVP
jgi:hypothetical protein